MYTINQTDTFEKKSVKFFKKHRDLVPKFKEIIEKLITRIIQIHSKEAIRIK
ncbi:MAG: Unknown protein [uncultured Sulfurovum sp.]|uniref:Uncharacterized protein n=1 Tax=uncultured Sulfurovum sp. TaxID=269237 RepID=A0A6S6UGK6_9BACT|nr:MAG: Unknown protein [uncultured Sulfurovum sp.]